LNESKKITGWIFSFDKLDELLKKMFTFVEEKQNRIPSMIAEMNLRINKLEI